MIADAFLVETVGKSRDAKCEEGDLNPSQNAENQGVTDCVSPVKPPEPPSIVPGGDTARAGGKKRA
jgi:hypothetical protein